MYFDLNITGTLGVILKAREKQIIPKVKPLIDGFLDNGIYIGRKVYGDILKLAGLVFAHKL